jgi:hypothetical protein
LRGQAFPVIPGPARNILQAQGIGFFRQARKTHNIDRENLGLGDGKTREMGMTHGKILWLCRTNAPFRHWFPVCGTNFTPKHLFAAIPLDYPFFTRFYAWERR